MRWCGCLHIVPRDESNHCKMLGRKIGKTGYRILPFHAIYIWSQLFERWIALYIHPINPHPLDSAISFRNTYPLDSAIQGLNNLALNFVVSSTLRHFINSLLTGLCQQESMRAEVMQITFSCQN